MAQKLWAFIHKLFNSKESRDTPNIWEPLEQVQVSEVRVRLSITLGYARPPKVRDISSKYYPPPFGGGPYFLDAFLRPRLVLG